MSDAPKTVPTGVDPRAFLGNIAPPTKRADAEGLLTLFERVSGEQTEWSPRCQLVGIDRTPVRAA